MKEEARAWRVADVAVRARQTFWWLMTSLTLLLVDPFDLSDWTGYAAANIAHNALSVGYVDRPGPPVSVILADDDLFKSPTVDVGAWPLKWDVWGDLIRGAADSGARAIFVDIIFMDERPEAEVTALEGAIRYAAATSIVYLATSSPVETGAYREIHHKLWKLSRDLPQRVKLVSILRGEAAGLTYSYPLTADATPRTKDSGPRPSAADAIVRDVCAGPAPRPPGCRVVRRPAALDLWWPRPDDYSCLGAAQQPPEVLVLAGCRGLAGTFVGRLWQLALAGVAEGRLDEAQLARWGASPIQISSTPIATLSAARMVSGDVPAEFSRRMDGGVVLLGASFPGALDLQPAPLYGELPGVYSHGVAVSNLFTADRRLSGSIGDWAKVVYSMAFATVALGSALAVFAALRLAGVSRLWSNTASLAMIPVLIALNAAFELYILKTGPVLWGVVAGVITVATPWRQFARGFRFVLRRLAIWIRRPKPKEAPHATP